MAATLPADYFEALPPERKAPMLRLREVLLAHLPEGFEETMSYGMPAFVVPHSLYPAGYHCKSEEPLPLISFASQKSGIVLHHIGLYMDPALHEWLLAEWPKYTDAKPDVGKGCIRFKKPENIPFELMGTLAGKMTPQQWITVYEGALKK